MGNIWSSESDHLYRQGGDLSNTDAVQNQSNTGVNENGSQQTRRHIRYNLRRTLSRFRRHLSATSAVSLPPSNDGNSTQSNVGSRRRALSVSDSETNERDRQRPRIDQQGASPAVTEENDGSLFFSFILSNPEQGASDRGTFQAASEVIRNSIRRSDQSEVRQNPDNPPVAASNVIMVRVRQMPPESAVEGEQSQSQSQPPSQPQPPTTTTTTDVQDVLQWTVYFLMPSTTAEAPASLPPNFDQVNALEQAFAILRMIMSGDALGNSYEELTRLQEALGFVSRGATAEEINRAQLTLTPYCIEKSATLGTSCTICLLDYVDSDMLRTLPCHHSYHSNCIDTWLGHCNRCPLCREQPVATARNART